MFPHHECEIAQSVAANGKDHVKYWMHNNMITIDGQKMARSLNNFITLRELFSGDHERLEKAYSPMNIRFFILQAHYGGTLDFSNEALQASEKGMIRLMKAIAAMYEIKQGNTTSFDFNTIAEKCFEALNDDLNTPLAIAQLFEGVRFINLLLEGKESITDKDLLSFKNFMNTVTKDILGLKEETAGQTSDNEEELLRLILDLRLEARKNKDFKTSDVIRDRLAELGIALKDTKEGTKWEKT
jgi:cysteinyl-tRNA synthetase